MTLASMQPYFFPYPGYFRLIGSADIWVVSDLVQDIRRGWVHRNRVLHPKEGWQYVIVPVAAHQTRTMIKDVRIAERTGWREEILGKLTHYRRRAPYYRETVDLVRSVIGRPVQYLRDLNVASLKAVCEYIGLDFQPLVLSESGLKLGPIEAPADWALRIAEAVGADEYINPPGGRGLYDPEVFAAAGIRLRIQDLREFRYETPGYTYIPHLSIIDAMMWNSPEAIREFVTAA